MYEYSKCRTFDSIYPTNNSGRVRGWTIECCTIMCMDAMITLRPPTVYAWAMTLCSMYSLTELFEGYTRLRNNELDLLCYAVAIDMKFNEYTLALAGQEVEF